MKERPECKFWFYTRSFRLIKPLGELVRLHNCQGWLSVDADNYLKAIAAYKTNPYAWRLALMQQEPDELPEGLLEALKDTARDEVLTFPIHHAGRHATPISDDDFFVCPQVEGKLPLAPSAAALKPCQSCSYCLP